jgi:inhibitor of KinA
MTSPSAYSIIPASDSSLLVIFGHEISLEHLTRVKRLSLTLLEQQSPCIRNIHPAYASVLVSFDPLLCEADEIQAFLETAIKKSEAISLPLEREVEIQVAYGGDFGPDLEAVASLNHLSTDDVIRIHSGATYHVYFLGFSPGFPYLGGMDTRIATPRLPTPRTSVPVGSVAIGGNQTGVYPVRSPGGWRIIGRTPFRLFDPQIDPPVLLQMGDIVRFKPITPKQYLSSSSQ